MFPCLSEEDYYDKCVILFIKIPFGFIVFVHAYDRGGFFIQVKEMLYFSLNKVHALQFDHISFAPNK